MTYHKKNWQPDKKIQLPIYKQISLYLSQQIHKNTWPLGTPLPTKTELADQFNVDPTTVQRALQYLQSTGSIDAKGRSANTSWGPLISAAPQSLATGFVKARQADPKPLLPLSTGELGADIFPRALVQKAIINTAQNITTMNYQTGPGLESLRTVLAQRLQRQGMTVTADNILITSGSLQAIQLIVSLLEHNAVIYTAPESYLRSLGIFKARHIQFKELPLDEAGLDFTQIPNSPKQQLLYTIPTFSNPLGNVMSAQRRQDLVDFAQHYSLPVIEDSAYEDIWLDQQPPKPLQAYDQNGNVLYLGSISKTLAPGMRLGWVVGDAGIIARLTAIKQQTDYGASALSQHILTAILSDPDYDRYLVAMRAQLKERCDLAMAVLKQELGQIATWNQPKGGFYVWLTFPDTINMPQLLAEAKAHQLKVNPGKIYGPHGDQSIRLSYSYLTPAKFAQGIHELAICVKKQL